MKMSWMSRRRACFPFTRYSLSPLRNRRRVTVISSESRTLLGFTSAAADDPFPLPLDLSATSGTTSCARGFTSVIVTEANPVGLRSRLPAKMTSSMRAPRRVLADCSPRTQLMASLRLDFPHPLVPTTAVIPEPLNRISLRSQNDLKPWSSTRFSFSKRPYLATSWKSGHIGSVTRGMPLS